MNDAVDAAWSRLTGALRDAAGIVGGDAEDRAGGYHYLLNLLNSGLELVTMAADPHHPEIARPQDPWRRWALECPDALYGYAHVEPGSTYRLTGKGGNPHYLALSAMAGPWGSMEIRETAKLARPGELTLDDDGNLDVVIGGNEQAGNWLPLAPGTHGLAIRQFLYDWDDETPFQLTIERVGAAPPPTHTSETVASGLDRLASFVQGSATLWSGFMEMIRAQPNTVNPPRTRTGDYGATGDTIYGNGYFELADDDAVLIEVTPPPCHYWNIQFGDEWMQSLDYTYRQTALNGRQAVLDEDGVFRGVLAHRDPGVWNWFDTAGHRHLPMGYRWLLPTAEPPTPTARVVRFDDLGSVMPPTMKRITPEGRRAVLDRRRRAVLGRYGR